MLFSFLFAKGLRHYSKIEWPAFTLTHEVSSLSMLKSDFFFPEKTPICSWDRFSLYTAVWGSARTPSSETLNPFAENMWALGRYWMHQLLCTPHITAVALCCNCPHELCNYSYSTMFQSMASFSLKLQRSFLFSFKHLDWTQKKFSCELQFFIQSLNCFSPCNIVWFSPSEKKAYTNRWLTGQT